MLNLPRETIFDTRRARIILDSVAHVQSVQEILRVEPEIVNILMAIAQLPPNPEMNRWQVYTDLKRIFKRYVGWYARKPEISTERHYAAFVDFLDALIPVEAEAREG